MMNDQINPNPENNNVPKMNDNGTMNIMGISVDIGSILGSKVVDNVLANISEEDMAMMVSSILNRIFDDTDEFKTLKVKQVKTDYYGQKKEVESELYSFTKNILQDEMQALLKAKVKEKMKEKITEELADKVADELLQYAIEEYKIDMKNRLKAALVDNPTSVYPIYNGVSIQELVTDIVNKRMQY